MAAAFLQVFYGKRYKEQWVRYDDLIQEAIRERIFDTSDVSGERVIVFRLPSQRQAIAAADRIKQLGIRGIAEVMGVDDGGIFFREVHGSAAREFEED